MNGTADFAASVSPWRHAAILAAITFAVFVPTLSADFVYDARLQILTDPFPHDPRNWPAVLSFAVLGMDVLDFNRPVHLASLMLDAALWGRDPFGYHLTSILLHCVNVVLLWFVLRDVLARGPRVDGAGLAEAAENGRRDGAGPGVRLTATGVAAFAGPLLFAVHPIVTEAVCEPTFREDLLVAVFTLGALVLAARGEGSWRAVGCAACCFLACASKESGIAAPLVLGAYWWFFRRGEHGRFWAVAVGGGKAAAVAFLAARFLLAPEKSVIFESPPAYPGGSLAVAMHYEPRILALYAQLVAWPVNLCADYGSDSVRHLPLWLSLGIVVGIAGGLVWAGWRDRRIAFGTSLVVLPLLPVSNLVPIYRPAADRYLYLPLAGIAVLAACGIAAAWSRLTKERRQVAFVAGMVVLGLLAAACIARQRVWSTQMALWLDTAVRNPGSYSGANGLACALWEAGRFREAEHAARHAIRLSDGNRGDTWVILALALDGQGRTADADEAVATALQKDGRLIDPDRRVAALAMERREADAFKNLLARRGAAPLPVTPAGP
jgi:tetratricopeptide (TPR) repeat protein